MTSFQSIKRTTQERDGGLVQAAQAMVDSYIYDTTTGTATFIIPAGIGDSEAMQALNEYFRRLFPERCRDAIYAEELSWFEALPKDYPHACRARDCSQAREVVIRPVVEGTPGCSRYLQELALTGSGLLVADPRDQAIAGALHACTHSCEDLFQNLWVRTSVPGFALFTSEHLGIDLLRYVSDSEQDHVAMSGCLLHEPKHLDLSSLSVAAPRAR